MSNYLHLYIIQASSRNRNFVFMQLLLSLSSQYSLSQSNTPGLLCQDDLYSKISLQQCFQVLEHGTPPNQSYLKCVRSHLLHVIDFHVYKMNYSSPRECMHAHVCLSVHMSAYFISSVSHALQEALLPQVVCFIAHEIILHRMAKHLSFLFSFKKESKLAPVMFVLR